MHPDVTRVISRAVTRANRPRQVLRGGAAAASADARHRAPGYRRRRALPRRHAFSSLLMRSGTPQCSCPLRILKSKEDPMVKIAFVVAAAVLTTAPLVTPAKAQGVKMAQVDMQTGLHIDDPAHYSRDRRRYDSNATVGVGPGGVTISPRQRCRMETTTIKRDDGRRITRREHVCN